MLKFLHNYKKKMFLKTIIIVNSVFVLLYYLLCNEEDDWNNMDSPNDKQGDKLFNRIYYSGIVFSTIGFGDITPKSKKARTLTLLHLFTNIFIVYRIVSMK